MSMNAKKTAKYVFVTGGVSSSLGKGIISASLAKLIQSSGYSTTIQKFDPYINIDPGTLNPYEHGECYVTEDGSETDLDLGHYERFLNRATSQLNNITTGQVYYNVIKKERRGDYLGKTVQVVPHITDEIKKNIYNLGETGDYDVIITEIGGCVGDIESLPFIEAVRQVIWEKGAHNVISIHLTLIPYLSAAGELKTKPTQHSVKQLLEAGVQPDILVCRTEHHLPLEIKKKIALFCNVNVNAVIQAIDAKSIYDIPLLMRQEKLDQRVLTKLKLSTKQPPQLQLWKDFLGRLKNPTDTVNIALVGKYVQLPDAYKSINESFIHAGAANECRVNLVYLDSEKITKESSAEYLGKIHGILVAPGFGNRGIAGKICAIQYAREHNIPFLGICLGMQLAMVEFAQHVLQLSANSTEHEKDTSHPVISLMKGQEKIENKGGTMRLGAYACKLKKGSLVHNAYKKINISERHRHRYEFNNAYLERFETQGMQATGLNTELNLVEIMELVSHPYFLAVQFHPELKSTVLNPHPIFISFVQACQKQKQALE